MESSFDRTHESLNPPFKVDDKQNLFANTMVIGAVESSSQNRGLGLNHTVQSAIDKWAGKQAIDLVPASNSFMPKRNSAQAAGIRIVQAEAPIQKIAYTSLAATISAPPVALKQLANTAPTGLVINGVKSSYTAGSTLSIDPSFVVDSNGWKDVSKVDFWLTDSKGKRVELADATSFVAKDLKDKNSAKFSYGTSLKGIAAGDYKLNAVAYDKSGAKSSQFTKSMVIKPVNIAPQAPVITGIKSSYAANSTLSIDSGSISDPNGWQDVSKVDFYLTNAQNQRVELADVTTFSTQDGNAAKFNYATSLNGIAAGDYKLSAVAYDKAGLASNPFTQSFVIKPVNIAPQAPVITGVKSSYEGNGTLSIDTSIWDSNGWQDVSKVDFWLTDAQNQRIELDDVNVFSSRDANTAKFNYAVNLSGVVGGDYKLNAIAYNLAGVASTQTTQSFNIKSTNIAPEAPVINGIKSRYDPNSNLALDLSYVLDGNGWQDISKIDLWLTNSQGQRIELADVNKLAANNQHWAEFKYSTSLSGIANGNYTFNAVAYDKQGAASNPFTQVFAINTIVKPGIKIKLADPYKSFSPEQTKAFNLAVDNWEKIITNDKDISGVFNIVTILSSKALDGTTYLDTTTAAEAYLDNAIGQRSNIANSEVSTASPVDINGVDYHNRINFNSDYLAKKPGTVDLVAVMMHEIGHALGLEHEADSSLMTASRLMSNQAALLNNHSFDQLEKLGYKIDRNAKINWG